VVVPPLPLAKQPVDTANGAGEFGVLTSRHFDWQFGFTSV